MIDKIQKLLKEDPDHILFKGGGVLKWTVDGTYPFTLEEIGFFIYPYECTSHRDMIMDGSGKFKKLYKYLIDKHTDQTKDLDDSEIEFDSEWLEYPGRIWTKEKIISFWNYPDKENFKKVIEGLRQNGFHVDKTWNVEVKDSKNKLEDVLIPIDKYTGERYEVPPKERLHTLPPKEKSDELKKQGATPGYTKIKLPKDMTLAQYNSIIHQEAYDLTDFNTFYQE